MEVSISTDLMKNLPSCKCLFIFILWFFGLCSNALFISDLITSHPTPNSSILDVRINSADPYLIATAQSTGIVILWRISPETLEVQSRVECPVIDNPDVLVLSINFSPQDPNIFSASFSNGAVIVFKITENGTAVKIVGESSNGITNAAHTLEAWTSAFGSPDYHLGHVLFSGGDDATLIAHDMRIAPDTAGDMPTSIFRSRNLHDGGITSILPAGSLPTNNAAGGNAWNDGTRAGSSAGQHLLWTGGYDDKLNSIDLRMIGGRELSPYVMPRVKSGMDLGGGVWRLVPSPVSNQVLACCMYGGARILNPLEYTSDEPAQVVKTITEGHDSMVYGGDWRADGKYLATCSFYDKAVQVWEA